MAPQREWFEKDYYKVLGVADTATQKEITRAYRKLARDTHPDRNAGKEDRFKDVSAAYDVIGDPAKRKEYDEVRKLGPVGAGFPGSGAAERVAALSPGARSGSRTWATSATSSAACSGGGTRAPPGVGRAHPAAPVPSGAQTSKPSSISPSPMR